MAKILIVVQGGVIQHIAVEAEGAESWKAMVLDYDTDGIDPESLCAALDGDPVNAYVDGHIMIDREREQWRHISRQLGIAPEEAGQGLDCHSAEELMDRARSALSEFRQYLLDTGNAGMAASGVARIVVEVLDPEELQWLPGAVNREVSPS